MVNLFDIALHITVAELVLIVLGCLVIGFSISFLWKNRKGGEEMLKLQLKKRETESDEWRLKYYDLSEKKDKELADLSASLKSMEEKEELQAVEIEELTLLNQQLMLKQKNASAQQSNYVQEIEASKSIVGQLETENTKLRRLVQEMENDNIILKAQLSNARETHNEHIISEGLSSWGVQKLRNELEKLSMQNNRLENELIRLGKHEDNRSRQNNK